MVLLKKHQTRFMMGADTGFVINEPEELLTTLTIPV